MPQYRLILNDDEEPYIETSLEGRDLLNTNKLNKGSAFSQAERDTFALNGLLPFNIETLDQQIVRKYNQYLQHHSLLAKNIYLHTLHDLNETLFYQLVSLHLEEMLPIIYTPTVGEAVKSFSQAYRKPKGLYLSYPQQNKINEIIARAADNKIAVAVITDGEAVLGIGDQGIGGIHISSAKLMVYSLCGGINPFFGIPIQLDVGTNNSDLLNDPLYLGWRHERITGKEYDAFIHEVVSALTQHFPHVLLHWEDFARENARRILETYQDNTCSINGDIQGTGIVALAALMAGTKITNVPLQDHRIVIHGAGTAGIGIADQLFIALVKSGLSHEEARSRLYLLDSNGLITSDRTLLLHLLRYARDREEIKNWQLRNNNKIDLYDVVNNVHPTILIGSSTVAGAFNEEIVKTMDKYVERPIILPLSNPTTLSEATPEQLINWTNGKAIIATGSPFPDVLYQGKIFAVAQCNNALAFPGIGLGVVASQASKISESMLWAAIIALSECSPALQNKDAALLPKIIDLREVSKKIALAVAETARHEGLAKNEKILDFESYIERIAWSPRYYSYKKV